VRLCRAHALLDTRVYARDCEAFRDALIYNDAYAATRTQALDAALRSGRSASAAARSAMSRRHKTATSSST